jgi:hypothetical protein
MVVPGTWTAGAQVNLECSGLLGGQRYCYVSIGMGRMLGCEEHLYMETQWWQLVWFIYWSMPWHLWANLRDGHARICSLTMAGNWKAEV